MRPGAGISGVCAAAITPRRRGVEEIDLAALWALIDFLSSHKIGAIVLMDIAGEFVHFSLAERIRMMTLAVRRSRVPIVVNVSHSTLDCAVELAAAAMDAGATALLLMPPHFFRYSAPELMAFYTTFLRDTRPDIPVYLYNVPLFATEIDPDTAIRLLGSGFAGIVDASADHASFEAVRGATASATVIPGNDVLFTRLRAAGAPGAVSAAACAIPEVMLTIDRAITAGNTEAAHRLDGLLQEFIRRGQPFPVPMALKQAAEVRGLKTGEPHTALTGEHAAGIAAFREWFKGWLPGVQKECALA